MSLVTGSFVDNHGFIIRSLFILDYVGAHFKAQSNLNPSFIKQIFGMKYIPYYLRSCRNIFAPKPETTGYGTESARFLGSRIWHAIPSYIKESQTLQKKNSKIGF